MNLATKDIRHNFGRFALTTVGIGLLLMIVMGMGGIYRGLIREATLLVDKIGADLWLVQGSTRGPFAEISRVPANLEDRARAVPGVAGARRFVSHTIQREHRGRPLRMVVQGLSWPEDRGAWIPLVAGRPLRQAHFEMIADRSLGLPLGEKLKLGKDVYEVVGLTQGHGGDGRRRLVFFHGERRCERSSSTCLGKGCVWSGKRGVRGPKGRTLARCNRCCWNGRLAPPAAFPPWPRPK